MKPIKQSRVPVVAWFVVASVGIFMAVFTSVAIERIAIDSAVWFTGGMVAGGISSAIAVGLFSYLVYSAKKGMGSYEQIHHSN